MSWYNKILEAIILPAGDKVLGTGYISSLRKWRNIQRYSEDELTAIQKQKLKALLDHALVSIPFYRDQKEKLAKSGEPGLGNFPVMHKKDIKENLDRLLRDPAVRGKLIRERSSGSSGVQGEIYMSKSEQSNVQAIQTLFWEWAGYRIGQPMLQTGMTLKRGIVKGVKDFLFRTSYRSAFGMSESDVKNALKGFENHPVFFGGYASSLFVFAQVADKYHLKDIHFKSVISWGDKMFPHYRSLIENRFSAKVYDTYGTTEGFMIAAQKDLPFYYIMTPHVYLELLDDQGNEVADGEIGHVVVTGLDTFEMPLIRYYLGDLAVRLPKSKYPERRDLNFPLLERIIGRDTDIVRTASGKSMIVHFFTAIFEHVPEIVQFRVLQESIESMIIEYIPAKNFTPAILARVENKIVVHLGEKFPVTFKEVTSIPASPSGKPQIIVSTMNPKR